MAYLPYTPQFFSHGWKGGVRHNGKLSDAKHQCNACCIKGSKAPSGDDVRQRQSLFDTSRIERSAVEDNIVPALDRLKSLFVDQLTMELF